MSSPVDYDNIYGQNGTPKETPNLIHSKIHELDHELNKLPASDKQKWMQAQEKCPDLVTNDHKLQFLRCEVMNADLAAKRLVKYWDMRVDLFGPEKAFLPLKLDQALNDDQVALKIGFMRLVPAKDPAGRGIVFVDPSLQDKTLYERESMTRSLWYMVHAALEDETVQRKGIVFVGYPKNAQMGQADRAQLKLNIKSIRGSHLSSTDFLCDHLPYYQSVHGRTNEEAGQDSYWIRRARVGDPSQVWADQRPVADGSWRKSIVGPRRMAQGTTGFWIVRSSLWQDKWCY